MTRIPAIRVASDFSKSICVSRLEIGDCGQEVGDCGQEVADCGQEVADCGQEVASCGQEVASCGQEVAGCRLHVASCTLVRLSNFVMLCFLQPATLQRATLYSSATKHYSRQSQESQCSPRRTRSSLRGNTLALDKSCDWRLDSSRYATKPALFPR